MRRMLECFLADIAFVRPFSGVSFHMGLQAGRMCKSPATDFTVVDSLASVGPSMDRKLREIFERLFANLAFECLLMCVLLF